MREMKDSGVEWVGQIPKDWEKTKIKTVCSFVGSGTTPASNIIEYYDNGTIDWIQSGDIYGKNNIDEVKTKITTLALNSNTSLRIYKAPFIVMAMYGGSVGNTAISHIDACTNQACCCIKTNENANLSYMYYWLLLCKEDFLIRAEGGGQPNVSQDKIKNQYFFVSNYAEQKKIADCLDEKCSEIDVLTSDIQKQIDTLEQYKKSLVYMIVSKGIKKGVDLKETDSDVWNEIPCDWQIKDIKYLFEIVKRIAGKEGYDILSVTQRGLKVKDISNGEGQIAENYSGYQYVYPTDYVMNHMDLLTGWVDLSCQFGVTSPDYRVFRLRDKEKNSLDYYKYVMQCCYMNRIFYSLGQGVSNMGRWRLQTSAFNNFKVPVPPYQTQIEIAEYLNKKITDINAIIDLKRMQIGKITEYKKSLIYEYVTGKKEVM